MLRASVCMRARVCLCAAYVMRLCVRVCGIFICTFSFYVCVRARVNACVNALCVCTRELVLCVSVRV